jgi:hypothetical protein
MVMLVAEPHLEEQLRRERKESGADRFDEVWEGVYHVSPIPPAQLQSQVLPLNFRLIAGDARPVIEVDHQDGRQRWQI